ncbi:hypothetical protein HYQ45_017329 [Verticillium longisporum]|uniref:Uncharacterized protein n=1 Tax=Verticillium longisporum TaxID=100787 RepID=A0A8I3AIC8_VERLO|nr:hypothetical protein HYQ45_017329 [Verticillium longisporum]
MASRCSCTALTKLPIGRSTSQSLTSRSFSTTTSQQRGLPRISPESPDWIQIPRARQDRASESKPVKPKGTLPVPRALFPDGARNPKLQPDFLAKSAPLPTNAASQQPARPGSATDIRRRMAEHRRANLAAGVEGLWQRKQQHEARLERTAAAHQALTLRRRNAPERADDVLTRSTDHLAAEVDKLFGDDYFKKQASSTSTDADNAWDVWGAPPTLQHLGHLATKDATEHTSRTAKRQKSIAEELTGGQMD